MAKLSDLTEKQKSHFAWRLDQKTAIGYLTAGKIIQGDFGDVDIAQTFEQGGKSPHSAKIHARKVLNFNKETAKKAAIKNGISEADFEWAWSNLGEKK